MADHGLPECDWSDPETGECCAEKAPFGFGPPRLEKTFHTCSAHRAWGEERFQRRDR